MACCKRPLWWLVGSGTLILIGLVLIVVGILAKTTFSDSISEGLYKARYIDNTNVTEGCSTMVLGDTTCPGNRFQGWSMTSEERYKTCMLESSPSSKSLASASKWCKDGTGGCTKPGSCKPGNNYSYFSSIL